ncbi:hypothetical protein Bca4012_035464 [Brassica carinata]|uniref:DUF3527 domain protein n=1 Tax=Brassica carinata TaxID=52824 RepID=A0A8X7WBV9_BRACI|nr:hypothetical protein Bca52824_009235 [Brassica carinata]
MERQQRASKVHEDRYPSREHHHRGKDDLVKRDMLDPPSYLRRRRTEEDIRGKALSFGVLDWKQFGHCKEYSTEHGSYDTDSVEASASSLELDLATGVVKRQELDSKPQAASVTFSPPNMRRMQKEHQASLNKNLVEKEQSKACTLSRKTSPKLLAEAFRPVECLDRRHDDVQGECSSLVNVMERNQNSLLDQKIPTVTSKKERHASPYRRFSFSFSQMSRSFSSKESSSSVPTLSSASHASAKSGPLTFNDSVYTHHSTTTKPRTRSGPLTIPKSEKNVPLQMPSKPPTTEKVQSSSRSHAILQFTLRKGISLFQFVVDNNVLAATMKSSDSSTRSYTLYTIKEAKNKSGNWLGRHNKNDHPFVHTVIGQMKTNSDSATHRSESVLFGAERNEEVAAAIVQTRNRVKKQSTTSVILPSGVHTLPKDGNTATPLPLIERWESGGSCDCGGWDIGCKLRVLSNDYHTKSFSSFQLFDQERDEPAFKMVTHDNELHSVEFGSSVSLLEAFFISLAVSSHQNWCEEEEEAVLMGDGLLKRQTSTKYVSNPPVSPIGRV